MKTRINSFLAAVIITAAGCTTISDTILSRVENITRGVTQVGAIAALTAKPVEARIYLSAILKNLDASIASGTLTASQLGAVVTALDLDPNVVRWSTGGFLVYDALSLFWATTATDAAFLAAGRGMSAAITTALLTTPVVEETKSLAGSPRVAPLPKPFQMPKKDWAQTVPEPTAKNTKRI